eukprot:TRINITY_DN21551_c0_g1_i1.p1 TRINITY_DN21551_c0_g1~~TRINITY_DN21551_c0_g1_i1.p1  ORF type:complete len:619 (+),score=136.90 TRINITY_DN21551_c0_g1_i1:37-1893(+)
MLSIERNKEFEKLRKQYVEQKSKTKNKTDGEMISVGEERKLRGWGHGESPESTRVLLSTRSLPKALKVFGLSAATQRENEGRLHARQLSAKILQKGSSNTQPSPPRRLTTRPPCHVVLDTSRHRSVESSDLPSFEILTPTAATQKKEAQAQDASQAEETKLVPHPPSVPCHYPSTRDAANHLRTQLKHLIATSSERIEHCKNGDTFLPDPPKPRSLASDDEVRPEDIFQLTSMHETLHSVETPLIPVSAKDVIQGTTMQDLQVTLGPGAGSTAASEASPPMSPINSRPATAKRKPSDHKEFVQQLRSERHDFLKAATTSIERYNVQRHQMHKMKRTTLQSNLKRSWEKALRLMMRAVTEELEKQSAAERQHAYRDMFLRFEKNVKEHFVRTLSLGTRQILEELRGFFMDECVSTDVKRFEGLLCLLTGSRFLLDDSVSVLYSIKHLFHVSDQQFADQLRSKMRGVLDKWEDNMETKVLPTNDENALDWVLQLHHSYVGSSTIAWVLLDASNSSEQQCLDWVKHLSNNPAALPKIAVALTSVDPQQISQQIISWAINNPFLSALLPQPWLASCRLQLSKKPVPPKERKSSKYDLLGKMKRKKSFISTPARHTVFNDISS